MALALIVVSCLFAVTFGLLLFGPNRAPSSSSARPVALPESERLRTLEADAERRKREAEEARTLVAELRAELKQVKRKLHDQRASEKDDHDLVRARTEVERSASQQLEVVRGELAHALAELAKLRADAETSRNRGRPAPVAATVPPPAPAAAPAAPPAPPAAPPLEGERNARRFRELSDSDREKMERFEQQANRERARAQELQAEVRRLKGRGETQHRVWVVTRGELDLLKDKFKALEKRLNRTLLERDLLRRAIRDLEKKSGLAADRTELTADEVAASDRSVEDRAAAEAAEIARRTRPPEPDAPPPASTDPAVSGTAVEPAAPGTAPAPLLTGAEQHTEKAG
jgi:septal ring factor EnvC (AmiA/AmiB activator)